MIYKIINEFLYFNTHTQVCLQKMAYVVKLNKDAPHLGIYYIYLV